VNCLPASAATSESLLRQRKKEIVTQVPQIPEKQPVSSINVLKYFLAAVSGLFIYLVLLKLSTKTISRP
jgi:hypothetical protein